MSGNTIVQETQQLRVHLILELNFGSPALGQWAVEGATFWLLRETPRTTSRKLEKVEGQNGGSGSCLFPTCPHPSVHSLKAIFIFNSIQWAGLQSKILVRWMYDCVREEDHNSCVTFATKDRIQPLLT